MSVFVEIILAVVVWLFIKFSCSVYTCFNCLQSARVRMIYRYPRIAVKISFSFVVQI